MDRVTIKIPKSLYARIKKVIEGTSYNSVTEFVVDVLRDLVSSGIEKVNDEFEMTSLTKEEIKAIKRRLKNLGYL
ncbi:CopG family transcriptional regulator [Thermotoga sp. KOL6]|uniref:CopG family transcriptional regulator n=1 Tax=Thermotoga sp. KOL6 TaxID=126741 RepID=UPI000C76C893|nr:CopG family transcriptional regulator [Thermotoga sp. KOL6]PLV59323.1 CopG family transcriptional regulator [Thermotoga sp. KOL6]